MAKIRVYELAKKLNITNRALLIKLKAMNIEVKSHMSSLEEKVVAQIKVNLVGKKNKSTENRRPSVIRRRKKIKNRKDHPAGEDSAKQVEPSQLSDHLEAVVPAEVMPDSSGSVHTSELPDTQEKSTTTEPFDSSNQIPMSKPSGELRKKNKKTENKARIIMPAEPVVPAVGKTETPDSVIRESALVTSPQSSASVAKSSSQERENSRLSERALLISTEKDDRTQKSHVTDNDAVNNDDADGQFSSDLSDKSMIPKKEFEDNVNKKEAEIPRDEAEIPRDLEKASRSKKAVNRDDTADTASETGAEKNIAISKLKEDGADSFEKKPAQDKGKGASAAGDRKRKRKKRQKKSEPAKIIRLAIPLPLQQRKNAEPAERTAVASDYAAGKDLSTPAQGRSKSEKSSLKTGRDNSKTGRDNSKPGKGRSTSGMPAAARPKSYKNQAPQKDLQTVLPGDSMDKDTTKTKRKRGKRRKKSEDGETSNDTLLKGAQKKRKSVVEGKDLYEKGFPGKRGRKKDARNKRVRTQKTQITVPKAIKRRIKIDETIELSELARRMSIKANEMIMKLMGLGVMVTVNQTIDFDTASLVAAEFDYEVEKAAAVEDILVHVHDEGQADKLIERSPVVTIMGHVDHGKTSLLDVIRKSKIATGEAGGITQHIGAYSVQTPNGGMIAFLDTPGHEAFTSMRSRGAQVTDIVVLVVAADDGVMPQTIEAINHSRAAHVPVVVAVNKMDKPDADPDRVMRELAEYGLLSEEWGGDVIFAKVSAKAETGIDELLDMILLQAEVLELKANPDRPATGHVIEARLDAGRGPVATVLVEQGTLKAGQPVVCGLHSGKIRVMIGDLGDSIESAGPSTPVEIVGLNGVPDAGDEFVALASEKDAKQISESRMQKDRAKELAKKSRANLEKLFANMGADELKELKLLIKADVHGSLEALNDSIMKLVQKEVDIKIIHSGIGAINASDVSLASVSDAIIIGFNVRPTPKIREMAREENVDMRFYDIIYNVINDIKAALTGLMPSTFHENIIGRAEVRDTFVIPGRGTIAGCFIQDGKMARGEKVRLLRDGIVKCDTFLSSLRRFKDDAKEVSQGYECGIGIEKYNDIKAGDIIECYDIEERKASLNSLKE